MILCRYPFLYRCLFAMITHQADQKPLALEPTQLDQLDQDLVQITLDFLVYPTLDFTLLDESGMNEAQRRATAMAYKQCCYCFKDDRPLPPAIHPDTSFSEYCGSIFVLKPFIKGKMLCWTTSSLPSKRLTFKSTFGLVALLPF